MNKILKILAIVPKIAKAIVGGLAGSAAVPAVLEATSNTVIWNWEYMIAAFFGVGISVYVIPNKKEP